MSEINHVPRPPRGSMFQAQSSSGNWRMTGVYKTEQVFQTHKRTHSILTGRDHRTPNDFKDQTFEIRDLSLEKKPSKSLQQHQQLGCPRPEEWISCPGKLNTGLANNPAFLLTHTDLSTENL